MPRTFALPALLFGVLLCFGEASAQELERRTRTPGARQRELARHVAEAAGERARVRAVQWRRGGRPIAVGVQVATDRFAIERVRFADGWEAEDFAAHAETRGRIVERRGEQVVVLSGEGVSDPAAARRVLAAAWGVLSGPHEEGRSLRGPSAPSPKEDEPPDESADDSAPPAAEGAPAPTTRGAAGHGAANLIRHYLNGEPLERLGRGDLLRRVAAQPASKAAIGEHQHERIAPAYEALSLEDRVGFEELLRETGHNPAAQAQLLKALAAGNHLQAMRGLARQIRDKDTLWMRDNLTLTGHYEGAPGIKAQIGHGTGPAVVQAIRGFYDPVYALRVRQGNVDITAADDRDYLDTNFELALDQARLLETRYRGRDKTRYGERGQVVARIHEKEARGRRGIDDLLADPDVRAATGLEFWGKDGAAMHGTHLIESNLRRGRVVPIAVNSSQDGERSHRWVLATAMREGLEPDQGELLIHDPWSGRATWVSRKALRGGRLVLDGSRDSEWIASVEVPRPIEQH